MLPLPPVRIQRASCHSVTATTCQDSVSVLLHCYCCHLSGFSERPVTLLLLPPVGIQWASCYIVAAATCQDSVSVLSLYTYWHLSGFSECHVILMLLPPVGTQGASSWFAAICKDYLLIDLILFFLNTREIQHIQIWYFAHGVSYYITFLSYVLCLKFLNAEGDWPCQQLSAAAACYYSRVCHSGSLHNICLFPLKITAADLSDRMEPCR